MHFPNKGIENKPAEQMINYYYNHCHELNISINLPIKKKTAKAHFKKIWKNRDKLMHGHDMELDINEVELAGKSIRELSNLWFNFERTQLLVAGSFCESYKEETSDLWVERAISRYNAGFPKDALGAANRALMLDKNNEKAKSILNKLDFENAKKSNE